MRKLPDDSIQCPIYYVTSKLHVNTNKGSTFGARMTDVKNTQVSPTTALLTPATRGECFQMMNAMWEKGFALESMGGETDQRGGAKLYSRANTKEGRTKK